MLHSLPYISGSSEFPPIARQYSALAPASARPVRTNNPRLGVTCAQNRRPSDDLAYVTSVPCRPPTSHYCAPHTPAVSIPDFAALLRSRSNTTTTIDSDVRAVWTSRDEAERSNDVEEDQLGHFDDGLSDSEDDEDEDIVLENGDVAAHFEVPDVDLPSLPSIASSSSLSWTRHADVDDSDPFQYPSVEQLEIE